MQLRGGTVGVAADGRGTWSVPGGWLDDGETVQQAVVRETFEETGALVTPSWPEDICVISSRGDVVNLWIVTVWVRCDWVDVEPYVTEPEKCPAVGWVPLDQVLTPTNGRQLFRPLRKMVDEHRNWLDPRDQVKGLTF